MNSLIKKYGLPLVREAEQAVFAPTIGAAAGMVVREVIPDRAVRRIILPHGGPLALGEIGAPAFPVLFPHGVLRQPPDLSIHEYSLHHFPAPRECSAPGL